MTTKTKTTLLVMELTLFTVICGRYFFLKYVDHTSNGTISISPPISQGVPTEVSLASTSFISPCASFNYPKVLKQVASSPSSGQVIANYVFSYPAIYSWRLVVTIYNIPSGSITQNSDYSFRKLNPSNYQETDELINGNNFYVMNELNTEGFNKVAFVTEGKYQAGIALTSDNPDENTLSKAMNVILDSWKWR